MKTPAILLIAATLCACSDTPESADIVEVDEPAGTTDPAWSEPQDPIVGEGDLQLLQTNAYACDDGTTLSIDWLTRDGDEGRETQARATPAGGSATMLARADRFGPLVGNGNELVGAPEADRIELNGQRCEKQG